MPACAMLKQVGTLGLRGMHGMRFAINVLMNATNKTLRVAGKISKVAPKNPWGELLDALEEQHAAHDQEQSPPETKTNNPATLALVRG